MLQPEGIDLLAGGLVERLGDVDATDFSADVPGQGNCLDGHVGSPSMLRGRRLRGAAVLGISCSVEAEGQQDQRRAWTAGARCGEAIPSRYQCASRSLPAIADGFQLGVGWLPRCGHRLTRFATHHMNAVTCISGQRALGGGHRADALTLHHRAWNRHGLLRHIANVARPPARPRGRGAGRTRAARGLPASRPTAARSGPGLVFAAMPGNKVDGAAFAAEARRRGRSRFWRRGMQCLPALGVPVLRAADPRRALALMAARFYGRQPEVAVAVTGTSGKTSVADFTRQILVGVRHGRRRRSARSAW